MQKKRVWIYQAERKFTASEVNKAEEFLQVFVDNWKAHGKKLSAEAAVEHGLFVVFKVDETAQEATGCSIDESVHAMKKLGHELHINFFDRQRVAYLENQNVLHCSMAEFKELVKENRVSEQTLVYNNTITHLEDKRDSWLMPAGESWHKMLFN